MKRLTLEATDENILNSIKENKFNRNQEVKGFVESLDLIEGNMFISLDARWGEGKTFYIRQIQMTLDYLVRKNLIEKNEIFEQECIKMKAYFENTCLNNIELNNIYFPIYYNSWLYDNHNDPLLSLLFIIIKKMDRFANTNNKESLIEKIKKLVSSISFTYNFGDLQMSLDFEKIINVFAESDNLQSIIDAENIRILVNNVLDEVLKENGNKLVIFIDELDRCRPTYAVEMLERIKHYFDNENLIFVISINKEQLIHTISTYYGSSFDSTGYLNKFFDLETYLPVFKNPIERTMLFENYGTDQDYLIKISRGLARYYRLTLRELLSFKQIVEGVPESVDDYNAEGCCLSLFIPIIAILNIRDEEEKVRFLNGTSNIIEMLANDIPEISKLMVTYGEGGIDAFEVGLDKFKIWYKYSFYGNVSQEHGELIRMISGDLKRKSINICDGLIRK